MDSLDILTFDPRTGESRAKFESANAKTVMEALSSARTALPGWANLTHADRSKFMFQLADGMERRIDELCMFESMNTGKPRSQALSEINHAIDTIRFFAGAARTQTSTIPGGYMENTFSYVTREPVGVVGVILPWNYPTVIWAWRIGAILASGSTAVVKPAEQTPYSAVLLQDICLENLPLGVVCTVLGGEETGKAMTSANFDCIAFTGSTSVGREISREAFPAKTSLELGGNGPVIFFEDAPGRAAKDIAAAALYNNGQSCAAPARVIAVGKAAFERASRELTEEFSLVPTNMPSISIEQAEKIERFISETSGDVVRGITTQESGKEDRGYWVKPALVTNPSPMDDVVSCEVFGPVLTVQLASDLRQAVEMANMFGPGLSGSVWGSDLTNIKVCEQAMDVGEVWVNCHLAQTPEIPHPGRGLSGNGADMGADAIREYQHVKAVHERYAR